MKLCKTGKVAAGFREPNIYNSIITRVYVEKKKCPTRLYVRLYYLFVDESIYRFLFYMSKIVHRFFPVFVSYVSNQLRISDHLARYMFL